MKPLSSHGNKKIDLVIRHVAMALCLGISSLGASFHYVLAHSAHPAPSHCDAETGDCIDPDCGDGDHTDPPSHCVVCVSLDRTLGADSTASRIIASLQTDTPGGPEDFSASRLTHLPVYKRGPPPRG